MPSDDRGREGFGGLGKRCEPTGARCVPWMADPQALISWQARSHLQGLPYGRDRPRNRALRNHRIRRESRRICAAVRLHASQLGRSADDIGLFFRWMARHRVAKFGAAHLRATPLSSSAEKASRGNPHSCPWQRARGKISGIDKPRRFAALLDKPSKSECPARRGAGKSCFDSHSDIPLGNSAHIP